MKTYKILPKEINGTWIVFSLILMFWIVLLLTSKDGVEPTALALLILLCYLPPFIGSVFIYVTINER
jgi:hypothetical protein